MADNNQKTVSALKEKFLAVKKALPLGSGLILNGLVPKIIDFVGLLVDETDAVKARLDSIEKKLPAGSDKPIA